MTVNAGSDTPNSAGSANEDEKSDSVSYETYKKVLDQRKADRDRARELQAQLDASKAEREQAEKDRMAEQAKFKELWESEKKRAEELNGRITQMTQAQVEARKREAIKSELGGLRKDDYLKFADLSAVQLNDDGSVDPDSVRQVAAKFRESYPELVTPKSGSRPLPNQAASGYQPAPEKPLHERGDLKSLLSQVSKK